MGDENYKHHYELDDTDISDFSNEVIYAYLTEHSTDFPGEEFLTKEEGDRCCAYLTRVDENAKIIEIFGEDEWFVR